MPSSASRARNWLSSFESAAAVPPRKIAAPLSNTTAVATTPTWLLMPVNLEMPGKITGLPFCKTPSGSDFGKPEPAAVADAHHVRRPSTAAGSLSHETSTVGVVRADAGAQFFGRSAAGQTGVRGEVNLAHPNTSQQPQDAGTCNWIAAVERHIKIVLPAVCVGWPLSGQRKMSSG